MELHEVLRRRRMTRRFSPETLPPQLLDRLLDAARRAPSAGFAQGLDLLVLTSSAARERFWALASEASWRERSAEAAGLLAAPAIVLPLADPGAYLARYGEPDKAGSGLAGLPPAAWPQPYWLVDAAFATHALLLAAEAEGLGALFFRLHGEEPEVLEGLGVPPGRRAIGALALGRRAPGEAPSGSGGRRSRRPLAETVHREGW